jgi:hypothetical protein
MSKYNWQKIISAVLLCGMVFSAITPLSAMAIPAADDLIQTTDPNQSGGAIVKGPFPPADNDGLPPGAPFEPSKGETVIEQPGTFPLPKSERLTSAPEGWVDPALQSLLAPSDMPATIQNWEGISSTGVQPPDTDGQVGPNHYVQVVNSGTAGTWVRVWDKTGTQLYDFGMDSLWPSGDPCYDNAYGDPVVLYDQMADRWVLTQFIYPIHSGSWYECIAVSAGPNPTNVPGDWNAYSFPTDPVNFPDYPKFGVWPDGYYMMAHQFANASSWAGTGVFVFDRDAMLAGDPATFQYVDLYSVNPNYGGMLPANLMGSTLPPANSPNYFVEVDMDWDGTDDILTIFEAQTTWPSGFTFNMVDELVVAPYVAPVCSNTRGQCIDQPNTATQLEAISDRLMMHAWYRNMGSYEVIVTNHTVDVGSNIAGIRWYEIRKDSGGSNWYIYQQGTYSPDSDHRWMGSIAMDHVGNMALGYSVSSTSTYPTIRYAGRLASDPLNTLPQAEATIIDGLGYHTGTRWGDYSAMSVDPMDDCTFWYTQEYVASVGSGSWNTRVASFKFPNCTIGATGTIAGSVTDSGTSAPISGASVIGVSPVVTKTFGTTTNASGDYQALALVETYTVTASAYGYQSTEVSGVVVAEDMTTTLDIQLDPATTYTVDGVVTDATTGWPLYASIDIAGYPGDPIWTDPLDGSYSIVLPEGITYTFDVEAFVAGYDPVSREVGPLTGDTTEDFELDPDLTACEAPGYQLVGGFAENFDSVTPSALPVSWAAEDVDGTSGDWLTRVGTRYPSGYDAHSTPNLVYFNSFSVSSGSTRLYYQNGLNMTAYASSDLTFWMFRDDGYTTNTDYIQVQVSTDSGATWDDVGPQFMRYSSAGDAWEEKSVDLSTYSSETDLLLGFLAVSDYGNDIHLDDVTLGGTPGCVVSAGGLVVGNVYEENLMTPLNGAIVENEAGYATTTVVTTADPNVDDGFYTIFSPSGSQVFTATMAGNYGSAVETVSVVANDTVGQDFYVPAGWIDNTPGSFDVTVDMGLSTTLPLTLSNMGGLPAGFEMVETNAGYSGLELSRKPLKQEGKVKTHEVAPYTLRVVSPLAVGDELFQVDAETITGDETLLGMEYAEGYFWVTGANNDSAGAPNYLYKIDTAGNLVATYPQASDPGWGWRDLAYDGAYLYASDSALVEQIDPATGAATGVTIACPINPCRALAYDPATDHFWTASFSSDLYEFDRSGSVINSFSNSLAVYGAAWDVWSPGGPYLWVWSQDGTPGVLATQIDPVTGVPTGIAFVGTDTSGSDIAGGATIINGDHPDFGGMVIFAGLHQATPDVIVGYDLEAVAGFDIPWLSEDPITGTVSVASDLLVDVTFDAAAVDQPGDYTAELRVLNDTPYGPLSVPVTMTVPAPVTWGELAGNVSTMGYCDANYAPLEGAQVLIESGSGMSVTLMTDASGAYSYWFDEALSPLMVTVSMDEHEAVIETGVMVVAGEKTTSDFNLRWLVPCVSAGPNSLEVTVVQGYSTTVPLELINQGAISADFEIVEVPGTPIIIQEPSETDIDARSAPEQAGMSAPTRIFKPEDVLLDEGFEGGVVPPAGWSVDIQNASYSWKLSVAANSGTNGADVEYDPGLSPQDEWLLSPEYSLSAGTLSLWSQGSIYWCRDDFDNCDLNVWLVVGDVGGSDDVFVGTLDSDWPDNWIWTQSTYNLTPLLPGGSVRIGFQYVGVDGAQVVIDDIILDGTLGSPGDEVPWLSTDPVDGTVAADGYQNIAVTFESVLPYIWQPGTYTATLNINNSDSANDVISIPVTMNVIAPEYGLSLEQNMMREGRAGDTIVYELTLTNLSNTPPDSFVIVAGAHTWATTVDATVVGPLAMGEPATITVEVAIPTDASWGASDAVHITAYSSHDLTKYASVTLVTSTHLTKLYMPVINK